MRVLLSVRLERVESSMIVYSDLRGVKEGEWGRYCYSFMFDGEFIFTRVAQGNFSLSSAYYSPGRLSRFPYPPENPLDNRDYEPRKERLALFRAGGRPRHRAHRCLFSAVSHYEQLGCKRVDVCTRIGCSGLVASAQGGLRLGRLGFRPLALLARSYCAAHARNTHCGHDLSTFGICRACTAFYACR